MKKNVLIIVIDALSKWYIDQCKTENSFFGKLEKKTYCANNMFSNGPFTEVATRGLWASQDSLSGTSYLCESYFDNTTMYEQFKSNGYYIYVGELIPFFTNKIQADNSIKREACEVRGFDHIWRNRLQYYIELKKRGFFLEDSIWKVELLLEQYFNCYSNNINIKCEEKKYFINKREYIEDILENELKSSFFVNQDSLMYFSSIYRNCKELQNILDYPPINEEMSFIVKAKYKNLQYLVEMNQNKNIDMLVEKELEGTNNNRCVHSNNDLLSHLRGGYEKLPKLRDELNSFLIWYDQNQYSSTPFWAYIHNFDFHFPENFMNNKFEDRKLYLQELKEKEGTLSKIKCCNMSVSKQLSIMNIEKCLEEFWEELEKRKVFNDTYVILTADHGISNFMNSLDKPLERWNYKKSNFQVPFYMQGCGVRPYEDYNLHSAKDILPTLLDKCNILYSDCNYTGIKINTEKKDYLFTTWINGIPDLNYKPIRVGIRDKKYSITCEAFITQFIGSAKILGIYDLEHDKNETNCLSRTKIQDKNFDNLFEKLKEEWFKVVISVLSDYNSPYNFYKKYKFLDKKKDIYKQYNKMLDRISWDEFRHMVDKRKIILFGVGQSLYSFLGNTSFNYEVKEIWDNDPEKNGRYIFGNVVKQPNKESINDDVFIVITSRYEIEIVEQLCNMGIDHFCIGAMVG